MTFHMPHRELSVTEILNESLGLYSTRFECFLVPFLLTNLVNGALRQLIDYFMPSFILPQDFTEEFFLWLINYLVAAVPIVVLFFLVGWVIGTLSNGIAVKCSLDILEGRQVDLKRGFDFALSNLPALLAVGSITGILTILGLTLFVVPGIIAAVMFSLAVQVVTAERLGASESLRRSRKLVAGRWAKTFVILFSVFLVTAVAYMIGEVVGGFFASSFGIQFSNLRWLVTSIITSLAQPLHPIALTYFYYSMRVREKPIQPAVPAEARVPVVLPPVQTPTPSLPAYPLQFCFKCGQRLPPDGVYCPWCGVRARP